MRRTLVFIGVCLALVLMGVGLWAVMAPPTAMAAELPRTVEEQAEKIGDSWAAWLIEDCGDALPLEALAGPREELVEGVKDLVHEPLTMQEFSIVERCMMSGLGIYTPRRPPHELELRRDVRTNLYNLDYYLANPRPLLGEAHSLSEDPYLQVWEEVAGQIAELFYLLQGELTAELAPMMEDPEAAGKAIAGGVLKGGFQLALPNLMSPTTPVFKRPLTEEEMEYLRTGIGEIARRAGDFLEDRLATSTVLVHSELFGDQLATVHTPREATAEDVGGEAGVAASSLAGAMQRVYWDERPPMLSADEQEALQEALAARRAVERAEPILSEELTLFDEWFRVWDEAEPAP